MSNLPKLPPQAQAGDGTLEGEWLSPCVNKFMTDDKLSAYRRNLKRNTAPLLHGVPEPRGAEVLIRRGKTVWRIPGKAGADLDDTPVGVAIARMEQSYRTEGNKVARKLNLLISNLERKGVKAHKSKADQKKDEVLFWSNKYTFDGRCHSDIASLVATQVNLTARRIRQIWKKENWNAEKGK